MDASLRSSQRRGAERVQIMLSAEVKRTGFITSISAFMGNAVEIDLDSDDLD